jgi:hypothetical protein
MAALEKVTLYPIHGIALNFVDDFPFDVSLLPASIVPDVTLEEIPRVGTRIKHFLEKARKVPDSRAPLA